MYQREHRFSIPVVNFQHIDNLLPELKQLSEYEAIIGPIRTTLILKPGSFEPLKRMSFIITALTPHYILRLEQFCGEFFSGRNDKMTQSADDAANKLSKTIRAFCAELQLDIASGILE